MDLFPDLAAFPTDDGGATFEMGASSTQPVMEKKTPRLRRSCELCRNSKGRCCPSKDSSGCQRCVKEGKQCIFLEAKPRPKRAKNSRIRVAEMEERLDGLVALLTSNTQATREATAPPLATTTMPLKRTNQNVSSLPSPETRSFQTEIFPAAEHYYPPPFSFPDLGLNDLQDPISKNIISFEQAEESIRYFRLKASRFPFVIVPSQMSLDTLRRERPFFLLSILMTASQKGVKLQDQLELELKESLGKKAIVNGEKSLDILQGILVYIAWYHFYFKTEHQQMYQLIQMAIAMAAELRIDKPIQERTPSGRLVSVPFLSQLRSTPEELEKKRTFIGSCYLASSVCRILRKPPNIRYGSYTEECCQALARAAESETDHLIPYIIRLEQFAEDVSQAFGYSDYLELPELDTVRIEILCKTFSEQFEKFESTFPAEVWNNASIRMNYYFIRIYVNEIGFHAKPRPPSELLSTPTARRSWYYSASRSESVIRCVQSSKDYLDRFISLTDTELLDVILVDLLNTVYAVLVIAAFTSAVGVPTLDRAGGHELEDLDRYLDAVTARLQGLAPKASERDNATWLCTVTMLLQSYKFWFHQILDDPSGVRNSVEFLKFPFEEVIPSDGDSCVPFPGLLEGQQDGIESQWEDILATWAPPDPPTMSIDG